jgi:ATP-dependent protease ClpP protease subunit
MKKILAVLFLAISLGTAHSACAADLPHPTEPPPFTPAAPRTAAPDLDKLMHLLDDPDDKPKVSLVCKERPCVFGYRINGSITDDAAEKLEAFMSAAVAAEPDAIMLELDTPGGSLSAGHEMSRMIEHAPVTVACVVDGEAYSMGMYILQSCDVRVMTKRSSLMTHQVSFMVRAGARLTQKELDDLKVQMTISTRGYIEWVAHRMRVSVADVLARVNNGGQWFMNWEEALKVGAVDLVISDPPEAYFQTLKHGGARPRPTPAPTPAKKPAPAKKP